MPATSFEIESLLGPLADDAPGGPALDHDPDFQALERAASGTPERQFGDKIFPAEPPEWPAVFELALGLARRTRDLRLAVWLARAGAQLQGLGGAMRGLQLLRGLVDRHWDWVHPQLDAEDDNDPTMRLNALLPLYALDGLPADLRAAGLSSVRGSMRLRELELGLGHADPTGDESAPTEAGVLQGLTDLLAQHPEAAEHLEQALEAAQAIAASVDAAVGNRAPDSSPLTRLLGLGVAAVQRVRGSAADEVARDAEAGPHAASEGALATRAAGAGSIRSRNDALRELERVCEWLERNEPSNPAPLLIRRAQRLINMSFVEIIRDLAPAGVDQVQLIAGVLPESE